MYVAAFFFFSYNIHIDSLPFLNPFALFPALGRALASAKRPLVYGGGWAGIMGVISSTVLEEGGKVVGVMFAGSEDVGEKDVRNSFCLYICTFISFEIVIRDGEAVGSIRELFQWIPFLQIIIDSTHARIVEMAKRAEGFIGLPGGFGTFEEV